MDVRRWRERMGGWGLLLVGGAVFAYLVSRGGTGAPFLTALFGVLALGGVFIVRGRLRVYYYLLPVVGVLALLQAAGYYLNYGTTALTLAFVVLGAASFGKGVQAYRAFRANGEP